MHSNIMKFTSQIILSLLIVGCATSPVPKPDPAFSAVRAVSSDPLPIMDGAIYRNGYQVSLFEDSKAKKVGDIITVMLLENTNATKKASTNTTKDSSVDLTAPSFLGKGITRHGVDLFAGSASGERSFKGEGDTAQSNTLRGTISVVVSEILPNGNLQIRGEKLMTLSQGVEHIRLSGIVRPDDIEPNNTIQSAKIANSKIIYGGQGAIAESNTKGWLQRFFDGPWWPF
jgi:flagellar L-ring protein precursor FlgH